MKDMVGTAFVPDAPVKIRVEMTIEQAETLVFIARHDLSVPDFIVEHNIYKPMLSNVVMSTTLTDLREALQDALKAARP